MRIGYGYKRRFEDFEDANVERVYIDHADTLRLERTDMFHVGCREGDVLVLLGKGDLGFGGEIKMLRDELAARGVEIEIHEPVELPQRPGPKPQFDPPPEIDRKIGNLWHNLNYSQAYVLKRASQLAGMDVKRYHLTHRYGTKRGTPKKTERGRGS